MASDPTSAPRPGGHRDCKGGGDRKPVRMGKYEVVKHIATGGMGAVYKARDTEAGRDVALKVLPKEMAEKPAMLERFKREARSAAKLRHENIVTLLESGEYHGTFYLTMEFVEGVDLHEHVKKRGLVDGEEARRIVLQGARALRHAHEMGIVHRDIKPSNFLLSWDAGEPRVKLLDFGLARELDDDLCRVTKAGTTLGTIDYMSPEQARDSGAADIRSDLYSLGATWYHLLAGQAMFAGGGVAARLLRLMREEPPDLRDLNPAVSDEAWDVIRRLLAKAPTERYQTPDELIEALDALEGGASADPTRPIAKPMKRRGPPVLVGDAPADDGWTRYLAYALAGAAALLMLGVVIAALSMPRHPPETDGVEPPPPPRRLPPTPTPPELNIDVMPPAVETPPAEVGEEPLFEFLGWDSLFSGGGTLFDLPDVTRAGDVKWRAVNCLYAGWKRLLPGAADHAAWQQRWGHVEGPRQEVPEGYVAAISVAGSGDPAADKGRSLAANECVFLSSKAGVVLDGVGCRAALRQCLVVTGGEGLRLLPGKACRGRAGMGAALTNVTFACQRAVAYLGDAPSAGVPTEPVMVQARDCAYLNPFPGKPSKAGLLVWEGDALPRGLLVWHGQGEGFDKRLHFAASPAAGGISDTKEGYGPWERIWGAAGARNLRPLSPLVVFDANRWALGRLSLRMRDAPGANLERLGVAVRRRIPR